MITATDTNSLDSFKRRTKQHIDRLRETGRPQVLTVNGKPAVVVQDAESYQRLLDQLDLEQSARILRERLDHPLPGIPVDEAFRRIAAKVGVEIPGLTDAATAFAGGN